MQQLLRKISSLVTMKVYADQPSFQFCERPGGIRWKREQLGRVVLSLTGWIIDRFFWVSLNGGTRAKATSLLQLIQKTGTVDRSLENGANYV